MNLISPFEFYTRFSSAKSMAIVGNAPTILDYENGELIDQHDLVVRFNRATTKGIENKIGSKTDILVVNASNNCKMAEPPSQLTDPRCLVSFISPGGLPNLNGEEFGDWIEDIPLFITFGMDAIGLPGRTHARPFTSGTYFLYLVAKMFDLERVFLTGFTMFGAKQGETGKYYDDPRPAVGTFHDIDIESIVFADVLGLFDDRLTMTNEINTLLGNSERKPKRTEPYSTRIASAFSWRLINLGIRLRRFSEVRK